jgi:hypothetical protein
MLEVVTINREPTPVIIPWADWTTTGVDFEVMAAAKVEVIVVHTHVVKSVCRPGKRSCWFEVIGYLLRYRGKR